MNVNVYTYDIWDGNKGIILAEDKEQAIGLFREAYPGVPLLDIDTDSYDPDVGRIDLEIENLHPAPCLYAVDI